MTRGKNEEREFLKRLDVMLAGQEIAAGEDIGDAVAAEELRGMVEFASKLVDLHDGPTPEFSQRLKSRLLIKLTEQDEMARARAERGWFSRLLASLVPASRAWRSAAVSLVVVVAVVTVLWRTGMFTGTAGLDTPAAKTVTSQATERAMAPQALGAGVVEETADDGATVSAMTAPAPQITLEMPAVPAPPGMAVAGGGGLEVVVGDVKVELLRSQVSARGIDIEVAVTADSAVSAEQVVAWYSIDGGPALAATDSTSRYLADEDATRVSWAGLDLAPSDATTLTFTIARIGEWEGPWVFEISLQD